MAKMASKKNFQQNGRVALQHQQRRGIAAAPYKKPFKPQGMPHLNNFNQLMFSPHQIPDNPGYLDFNNPTPPLNSSASSTVQSQGMTQQQQQQQKKKNKAKKNNKQGPQQQQRQQQPNQNQRQQNGGNWNQNKMQQQQRNGPKTRFGNNGIQRGGGVGFPPMPMGMGAAGVMPVGRMGRGPRGGGPMPPLPPPPHGFQPPMIPPRTPIARGPLPVPMGPQPPLFIRRNGRGPMPPIPPPPPHMQRPPILPPRGMPRVIPPIPFNGIGKIKKPNPKGVKKVVKGKSTIKTLKNLLNQYPLDKPWVTDEIRAEHAKKVDIENRLKGIKDDDLFAQFKVQRDKFVGMYETAREEYLKKEAAAVKAKDTKDKETIAMNAAKDETATKSKNETKA